MEVKTFELALLRYRGQSQGLLACLKISLLLLLKGVIMLNTVHVKFEKSSYNYSTSVSKQTTEEKARKYFVNKLFNLGHIKDDIQKCIGIVYEKGKS